MITTTPNELMATIHDRMPAIVHREGYLDWLTTGEMPVEAAMAWLRSYPAEEMEAFPVSPRVNSPRNEGEDLIACAEKKTSPEGL